MENHIWKSGAKILYLINKSEKLREQEKRKIEATLQSKYNNIDYFFVSKSISKIELNLLKKKIFEKMPIIRVYTKEPGKETSKEPMILKRSAKITDAAEKILNIK